MSLESLLNDAENLLMKWIDQNLPVEKEFNGAVILIRKRINGEVCWSACCEVETMRGFKADNIVDGFEKYSLANTNTDDHKTREEALIELCDNLVSYPLWGHKDTTNIYSSFVGRIKD